MNTTEVDPAELRLQTKLHGLLFQYSYFHVAGLCLLVYDFLLTLDLEIEFFWLLNSGGKWLRFSTLRVLFFVNRYLPIFTQMFLVVGLAWPNMSPTFCNIMIKHAVHIAIVIQWFAIPGAILCYRTCALYKGQRNVVTGIVTAYLGSVTISAIIVGLATKRGEATAHRDPGNKLNVCHGMLPDRMLYAAFIPPIVFDVCASFAAMYAILRHHRNSTAAHGSRLMSQLAKGTVLWLIVVVTSDLINLCIFAFLQVTMRHLFDGLTFAIISIASSRQLLHLRELGSSRLDEHSGASIQSATLPVFYRNSLYGGKTTSEPMSPGTQKNFMDRFGLSMSSGKTLYSADVDPSGGDVPMTPLPSPSKADPQTPDEDDFGPRML